MTSSTNSFDLETGLRKQRIRQRSPNTQQHAIRLLKALICATLLAPASSYSVPSLSISTPFRETANKPQSQSYHLPRRQRRVVITTTTTREQHHLPTEAWAAKYTSVDALRETFGGNKNSVWGDLDPASARKLYKTLLPNALLELHQYYSHQLAQKEPSQEALQAVATDLAPLAYQARVAAKLYARERCRLPARVAANLYDGFRQWRKYGKFQPQGMSYQQVWDKYANALGDECESEEQEEVIAAKIGLKILERACATNPFVDSLVLTETGEPKRVPRNKNGLTTEELKYITAQLEDDVRQLLWPVVLDEATLDTCVLSDNMATCAVRNKCLSQYRRLRQLARMKGGLDRLSSPFTAQTPTLPLRIKQPWVGRTRM